MARGSVAWAIIGVGIGLVTEYLQSVFPGQQWISPLGLLIGASLIIWGFVSLIRSGDAKKAGQWIIRHTAGGPARKVAHMALRLNPAGGFEYSGTDRRNIDFIESLSDGSVRTHFAEVDEITPSSLVVRLAGNDTQLPLLERARTQVRFFIPNAKLNENYVLVFECGRRSNVRGTVAPAQAPASPTPNKQTSANRITFIQFRDIAAREFGWDFASYSNQILSLANGLRQAAIDDDVTLWGRQFGDGIPVRMKENYPLKPVPKTHLETWWLNVLTPTDDNVETETYNFERNYRSENYRDIHIHSENAARNWLKDKGGAFKAAQPDTNAVLALVHISHHSAVGSQYGATSDFEKAARRGQLMVWGCKIVEPHGEAALDVIPRDYWQDAELDLHTLATLEGPLDNPADYNYPDLQTLRTRPLRNGGAPTYVGLRVNSKQVQSLWPKTRNGSPLK